MPERDFISVNEFEHRSTLSATVNKKVIEKIFIPRKQQKLFNELKEKVSTQFSLFPDIA